MYIDFLDTMLLQLNRLQYSVNLNFIYSGKPKKIHLTYFIVRFALLWCPGTKPAICPRDACVP